MLFIIKLSFSCLLTLFVLSRKSTGNQLQLISSKLEYVSQKGFSHIFWNFIADHQLIPPIVSETCWNDLKFILETSNQLNYTSKYFIKFCGKFPNDYANITYADMGNFDACINIASVSINQQDYLPQIKPKHCTLSFLPNYEKLADLNVTQKETEKLFQIELSEKVREIVRIGFCLPKTCNSNDLEGIFKKAFEDQFWSLYEVTECQQKQTLIEQMSEANIYQILCLAFLATLTIVMAWAGLIDVYLLLMGKDKTCSQVHHFFSPYKSLKALFEPVKGKRWIFFDQWRLYQFFSVFGYHFVAWPALSTAFSVWANYDQNYAVQTHIFGQPLYNTYYFETVIYLGGASAAVMLLKRTKGSLNIKDYLRPIVERFLQFQLIFAALMSIEIIYPLFVDGPFREIFTGMRSKFCQKNYYYSLLHITNLVDSPAEICIPHTWTFSVEFQMLIVISFIFYIRNLSKKIATILLGTLSFVMFLYTLSVFYFNSVLPVMTLWPFNMEQSERHFAFFYVRTLPHAYSYLLAALMISLIVDGWDKKFSKKFKVKCLAISLAMFVCSTFFSAYFNVFQNEISPTKSVIFLLVSCPNLALFIFFFSIYRGDECRVTCFGQIDDDKSKHTQKEKNVEQIVQVKWIDVALRLTRNAYYTHTLVLIWFYSTLRKPLPMFGEEWWTMSLKALLASYYSGLVMQILVIGPAERIHSKIKSNLLF